jgi:hypothetical protein
MVVRHTLLLSITLRTAVIVSIAEERSRREVGSEKKRERDDSRYHL